MPRTCSWSSLISAVSLLMISQARADYPSRYFDFGARVTDLAPTLDERIVYVAGVAPVPLDTQSGELLVDQRLEGFAQSLDISPSGRYLVTAANSISSSRPNDRFVVVHDLSNNTSREFWFTPEPYEDGPYDAAFIDDSTVLMTTMFKGSGWTPLRKVDLVTGGMQQIARVRQDTKLQPSLDRSVIGFAEGNSSRGPFGYFNNATQTVHNGGSVGHHIDRIAPSPNGSRLAIPWYTGVDVFDKSLARIGTIRNADDNLTPVDVVYSQDGTVLFVAWTAKVHQGSSQPFVAAYSAQTFQKLTNLDSNPGFVSTAFGSDGLLWISGTGRQLFAVRNKVLIVYDVSAYSTVPEPTMAALGMFALPLVLLRRLRR